MQPLAIGIVLLTAAAHVYWNLQVKRSPNPAACGCLIIGIGATGLLPLALWMSWPLKIPLAGWACIAGTGVIYAGYYAMISLSYSRDDLSRAYPIARGVAPAATALLGFLIFGERPTLWGWMGIGAIVAGVLALGLPAIFDTLEEIPWLGIGAAIATGLCTAGYSAIDKEGVRHVHPALYLVLTSYVGSFIYGAFLWKRYGWNSLATEVRRGGGTLILAAFMAVGSYLLVLLVLRYAPVSYVVPLRSVAVLLSVIAGSRFLGEKGGPTRLAAAGLILSGIVAIAVGG